MLELLKQYLKQQQGVMIPFSDLPEVQRVGNSGPKMLERLKHFQGVVMPIPRPTDRKKIHATCRSSCFLFDA
jgi:hypothetical protein